QDAWLVVEGHDEGLISIVADNGKQERSGGVLLKFEAVTDAVGSIHKQADPEGQVGLPAEVADGLRGLVVGNLEVVFLEVGDELVATIEDGEEHVDQVDGLGD